jgi:hypothetical protein
MPFAAHIDAISLLTKAFANGVKSDAIAEAKSSATGGDIGGLLGLHISNADLADLLNGTALSKTLTGVLQKAGVPTELHIFKEGGHGFGIERAAGLPAGRWWPPLARDWMTRIGMLD